MKRLLPLFLFGCLFVVGCGSSSEEHPGSAFTELEERMLGATTVSFDFQIVSEGVLEGNLRGSASVSSSGSLTIDADGVFIGREIQMQLRTDTDSLRLATNEMSDVVAHPEDTFRAVIIGLTRMGFFHNLAQLTTVSPPEHGNGGIAEWVTVGNFSTGPVGEYTGTSFDVIVEGEKTSTAVLAIEEGLPRARRQIVAFPGGEMVVTERYSNFTIQADD